MPVKTEIPFDNGHFFITFTCHSWLNLIDHGDGYDLIYNWFDILKAKGHFITGFVIMPNHLHATIAFRKTKKSINKIIGDGKRFIGYEIINRLKQKGLDDLLVILANAVNSSDKKRGKLHEVWEDSFDWKECVSDAFILQKLDYMHLNPCIGKWMLAKNPFEYEHSSARFYICGEQGKYPVTNFGEVDDIDLSIPLE
jgi:REP element-mobilizing transposase RayT